MGASQRRKGHNFEREVSRILRDNGIDARRGLQYREGGECADVITDDFWIECKRGIKPNIRAAIAQAIEARGDEKKSIAVVVKDDKKEPFVVMLFNEWLQFIKEI